MLTLHSILQHIGQFFRGLADKAAKKAYRSSAVFMAGAAVITAVAFTSTGFGGSGRNAITAFAETQAKGPGETKEESDNLQDQELLLAGDILEKKVRQDQAEKENAKAELVRTQREIVMEAEAKAKEAEAEAKAEAKRIAEEEAAKKAEEERIKAEEERNARAVSVSSDDYQVLLKIVQAEAGICDEKGRILVANVVLNRVKSKEFPNSVRGVVYERSQFSPVSNGSINTVEVTDKTRACVDRALEGEDYSQGALYFMYRGGSRRKAVNWFDSHLTYLFQHGNHEFFK